MQTARRLAVVADSDSEVSDTIGQCDSSATEVVGGRVGRVAIPDVSLITICS